MKFMVIVATAILSSQLAVAETVERQAEASPTGEVEIVNVAGEVRVVGWDRPHVQVKANLDSDVEELEFEARGSHTLVKVRWPGGDAGSGSSSLLVNVPRESSVMVKTVSASQILENVHGEQRLQSVSGEIESQIWKEDFQAKSVSGRIQVSAQGHNTSVRVTNVSGEVMLDRIAGDVDVSTVNGEIDVRGTQLERVRLKTTNGEVRFEGSLIEEGRFEAEAINGAVHANLRGKLDASFDIETFNGNIDNCFGPKPQRTSEYAPGNALRFQEGSGNARVRIKTLNGAVNLCRKP